MRLKRGALPPSYARRGYDVPPAIQALAFGCDVAALASLPDFVWQSAALLSGAGVAFGALAAMSMFEISGLALIGRVKQAVLTRLSPPMWVVAVDGLVVVLLLAGVFFGGELV